MVVCLERGADLHMAQLMPLPLTVSCFSKIQIGLPFWYRLTWVVPEQGPLNVCVCVCRSDHFWLRVRNWVSWRLSETFGMNILTLYPKSKAPYNVTIYKGSNQAALTRSFVLYFIYRYDNNIKYNNINNNYFNDQSYCESSPDSFDECRLSVRWPPTLKPSQWTWAMRPQPHYHPHPPSPLLLILSP